MSYVIAPTILLPKKTIDYTKWATIACDQFTSEKEYWLELKSLVKDDKSTLKMILPEAFLDDFVSEQINSANHQMFEYLKMGIFDQYEGMILVERETPFVKKRTGLVLAIDLEKYDFHAGAKAFIVASEKTVAERIPPRVRIRENAPLESPHVLVLIDDRHKPLIDPLSKKKETFPLLYDFNLNMDGGHLRGYLIKKTDKIIRQFDAIPDDIKMIVGDGNHSLASAKVCWEEIKKTLSNEELITHPARYALVEVISLYDEGLTFEPIHRVMFQTNSDFLPLFEKYIKGDSKTAFYMNHEQHVVNVPSNPFIAIKEIQSFLDFYLETHPKAKIDFVHGLDSLQKIVENNESAIGIQMPPLEREELFPYVKEHGVLPRKSFSLGEAKEKRYYMECRIIK